MAFECNPTAYQVIAESDALGNVLNSQFRSIDPVTGEINVINPNMGSIINAIGYNPIDNFIYGIYDVNDPLAGNLVRIDENGVAINLGPIPNLSGSVTNGAFDESGYFYIRGQSDDFYYTVDLNPASLNFGQLVDPTAGYILASPPYFTNIVPGISPSSGDWVYNPIDGLLYTVSSGAFVTIDPTTGNSAIIPTEAGFPFGYGGMFNDANGFIYGINNNTGQIIRWFNNGGFMDGELFTQSLPATRQDATMCINASMLLDFGDAPDLGAGTGINDYRTLLIDNGPRHAIVSGLTLGSSITSENDAYQNATATGDDLILGVQDDGVVTPVNPIFIGSQTYDLDLSFVNEIGENATIYGWIDFNRDGIFQNEEGAVPVNAVSIGGLQNTTLTFNIPNTFNLNSGDFTFARIRITTTALANSGVGATSEDTRSIGPAKDGEVEDYIIFVGALEVNGVVWYDQNCDGIRDLGEPLLEGVTVRLYSASDLDNPVATTTTDASGAYSFNSLEEGEYFIEIVPLNGYFFTNSNVGSDDSIDSDVDKIKGRSEVFSLDANNLTETIDGGLCRCFKIAGNAFYDCKKNGVLDDEDPYLCNVRVNLFDNNGVQIDTANTDCDGYYQFDCLKPGIYVLQMINPPETNYATQDLTYYGSKFDGSGVFGVNITTFDVLNVYGGFTGSFSLNSKYCSSCNTNCYSSCKY